MSVKPKTLPITAVLAVKNEEANLPRCLEALTPVGRVLVVDSQSEDSTVEIARSFGAEVLQFHYRGGYPKKRQWALEAAQIDTPWTLLVDADEVVVPELWKEVATTIAAPDARDAYLVTKGFHFLGQRFRYGGFSFRAVFLLRTGCGRFEELVEVPGTGHDMEIHERVIVNSPTGAFRTPLIHEDFKGLQAYIDRHNRYSTWEAHLRHQWLTTGRYGHTTIRPSLFGNAQERRRFLKRIAVRSPLEPHLWFFYHYILRLGFLEGAPGLIAAQIRADYIRQVRAKMHEIRLCDGEP